ncbi:hypothetical protein F5Y08DRAFT_336710 [Xylaria arbuscula]|nr:hypothetical protein F5Y08DRAFT_336710 [Xylaria arbuscula]
MYDLTVFLTEATSLSVVRPSEVSMLNAQRMFITKASKLDTVQVTTSDLENGLAPKRPRERSDEVDGSRLDTFYSAIGARGYQIQTQILRIPEQWGLFSPPPHLQIYEGKLFAILFCTLAMACSLMAYGYYVLYLIYANAFVSMMFLGWCTGLIASMYFVANYSHQRASRFFHEDRDRKLV